MAEFGEVDSTSVAVIGCGYVGTSLSAVLAEAGCEVKAIDIDDDRVARINEGRCPIQEADISDLFERFVEEGRISASTSYDSVGDCGVVLVTVGTPLSRSDPDLSAVEAATKSLGQELRRDHLVIYRSTLPAEATESTIRPLLEDESGLAVGEEFSLAFCPERMAEGSAYADLTSTPVVVGGMTPSCNERAASFWEELGLETVTVSSPTAAEFTKLADNWWIDLNIALANEVALLSEALGTDALEVIRAANTLEKGEHHVNILYPGSGVGGSCLVKDPWFVASLGDQFGLNLETPRVSRRVNDRMPAHLVDLLLDELPTLEDATIAVLGYAFKAGTDDTRNTPARPVIESLLEGGATVRLADPYVPAAVIQEEVGVAPSRLPECLAGVDVVLIVTGHDAYRDLSPAKLLEYVGSNEFVIVDGRHVFEWGAFDDTAVRYRAVGRGRRE